MPVPQASQPIELGTLLQKILEISGPDRRPDAGPKLNWVGVLGDEVNGPQIETARPVMRRAAGREQHNRDRSGERVSLEPPDCLEPVKIGQELVKQYQVWPAYSRLFKTLTTAASLDHVEPLGRELSPESPSAGGRAVHDQRASSGHRVREDSSHAVYPLLLDVVRSRWATSPRSHATKPGRLSRVYWEPSPIVTKQPLIVDLRQPGESLMFLDPNKRLGQGCHCRGSILRDVRGKA